MFEDDGGGKLEKKVAGYHQFHAVHVALKETLRASDLHFEELKASEEPGIYEAGKRPGW
ncbi:MAG: hypothetical protein KatS3mg087_1694 [Patescibacteria group bacterium]|nr:MAG: hypothetical protein KatS3mg087_1694 [Patescibacteria group bacterium]